MMTFQPRDSWRILSSNGRMVVLRLAVLEGDGNASFDLVAKESRLIRLT